MKKMEDKDWREDRKERREIFIDEENLWFIIRDQFGIKWEHFDFARFIKYLVHGKPSDVSVYTSIKESYPLPLYLIHLRELEQRLKCNENIDLQVIEVPAKKRGEEWRSNVDTHIVSDGIDIIADPAKREEIIDLILVSSDWDFQETFLEKAVKRGIKTAVVICQSAFSQRRGSVPGVTTIYLEEILQTNPHLIKQ